MFSETVMYLKWTIEYRTVLRCSFTTVRKKTVYAT